jgi:cysteinyl-tRNA synthetase
VLWKPSKPGEPAWPSPAGIKTPGRPGWHIECSAMSWKYLGEMFDIHGGGIDLVFPHHEDEIAQSRCAFHTPFMANYWMHNGFLQVEGEKMAKSAGNFVTIHELLENWHGYSWPGEALRLNMLRTHYRQPIDWTLHSLDESHKILWDWYGNLERLRADSLPSTEAIHWLCDDLNTAELVRELHDLHRKKQFQSLLNTLQFLGFSGRRENLTRRVFLEARLTANATVVGSLHAAERSDQFQAEAVVRPTNAEIGKLVEARNLARKTKNFVESDRIRDELAKMGVVLKDTKDGTTWEIAR